MHDLFRSEPFFNGLRTSSTLFTLCTVSVIVYIKHLSETRNNWNQPLVNNQAFSVSFLRMPNSTAPVIRSANIVAEPKLMLAHTTKDLLSPPANRGARRGSYYIENGGVLLFWERVQIRSDSSFAERVPNVKFCRSGT